MIFRRFYTQVSVVVKFSLNEEVDFPTFVTDEALIAEAVQEQVDNALEEALPKEWLDDVEVEIVAIQ